MRTPLIVLIGFIAFLLVGLMAFYGSNLLNEPAGEIENTEPPDPTPE